MLREGTPVDLGPAKQRAVLAVLLLHAGRPVPTHQIVDAVWGDDPPENGANVVQKYVAGLRRVLDPSRAPRTPGELLALTGSGYVLQITGHEVDADEFTATVSSSSAAELRQGLALWRGDALAGLSGPVFEAARLRLTEAKATAWERWAELSQDRDPALIPELSRLIGEFPLREGLRAQLMVALYKSGRQAEALAAFREARAYLLDEFGIEPGELLQETHRRVLRGEPVGSSPAPDAPAPRAPRTEPPELVQAVSPAAPASSAPGTPGSPASEASVSPAPGMPGAPETARYAHGSGQAWPPPAWAPPVSPAQPFAGPAAGAGAQPFVGPAAGAGAQPFVGPAAGPFAGPPQPGFAAGMAAFPGRSGSRPPIPYLEVIFAAILPLITLSLGSWIYFAVAAGRHHNRRLLIPAAAYFLAVVFAAIFMGIDPTDVEEPDSVFETIAIITFLVVIFTASIFGAVIATHSGTAAREWFLREQFRLFAAMDPGRALHTAVGRPDISRPYDDGGLVDLNHVGEADLIGHAKLKPSAAERIIASRLQDGWFRQPDELVHRGLITARQFRRVAPRLIALPPGI
ncbi:BTAD domain-containing putative transcriptional regulator [Actinoplanes sp. NPDC049596]|uniref:BTAD domain-containing putative transcriptional regulator n=1 Tax=unclassified Actinoplanes TaxID=2626549 RepID=UPI003414753D